MKPSYSRIGNRIHESILAHEKLIADDLIGYYGRAYADISDEVRRLAAEMAADPGIAKVYRMERLLNLQEQIDSLMVQYSVYAIGQTEDGRLEAVRRAQEDMEKAIRDALQAQGEVNVSVTLNRIPERVVGNLVTNLQGGKPLRTLFEEFGPQASQNGRDALVSGLIRGVGPEAIASSVRDAMAVPLQRSLRIARTEILRSYRAASLMTMQENPDIVQGWIWHADLGIRTCVMCIAMHGSFHRLEESLNDHVNGRCVAVPWTVGWGVLGYEEVPDTRTLVDSGKSWFDEQSTGVQQSIMGVSALKAYKAGEVDLHDFIGVQRSEIWGDMRVARSLRSALEHHGHSAAAGLPLPT